MRSHRARSARLLLALTGMGVGACGQSMTDAGRQSRVVLDVRSLLGSVLGGNFVSILDTARLTIASGGSEQTLTRRFGPGDSEVTFDVNVEPGPATFELDVISDSGVLLYTGETNTTIDGDGFAVTITPLAVSGVLVVSPRPTFVTADTALTRSYLDTLRVRNVGSSTLNWRMDSTSALPSGFTSVACSLPQRDGISCLVLRDWAPGTDEPIVVSFKRPIAGAVPPSSFRFVSTVGNVTMTQVP